MKKIITLLAFVLTAGLASAQTRDAFNAEFGGRVSVELDKKLAKGWHVYLSEELRFDENFAAFERFHTTLGTSYKFGRVLRGGVEYTLINPYKASDKVWQPRHRLSLFLGENFRVGDWTLSAKETFRFTHRAYDSNPYQSPRNPLDVKLRFQVKYRGFRTWSPYAGIEGKIRLNGASCSATYYSASDTYEDYVFTGYKDTYVSRLRGYLGTEFKLTRQHAIDVKLLMDYLMGKEIDTNSEGTKLKSITRDNKLFPQLCVGYTFSF